MKRFATMALRVGLTVAAHALRPGDDIKKNNAADA